MISFKCFYNMLLRPKVFKTAGIMWWIFALLSAFFAALTAIFAKIGIQRVDTDLATAIRTVVILVLAWAIAILEVV
jgi:uncharacterized membrane protein